MWALPRSIDPVPSPLLPINPQIIMASNQQIEELAAEIGDKVYIDVAKWHLYLKDAKLHTTLAEQVFPLLISGLNGDKLTEILTNISIDLGGGRGNFFFY